MAEQYSQAQPEGDEPPLEVYEEVTKARSQGAGLLADLGARWIWHRCRNQSDLQL